MKFLIIKFAFLTFLEIIFAHLLTVERKKNTWPRVIQLYESTSSVATLSDIAVSRTGVVAVVIC